MQHVNNCMMHAEGYNSDSVSGLYICTDVSVEVCNIPFNSTTNTVGAPD